MSRGRHRWSAVAAVMCALASCGGSTPEPTASDGFSSVWLPSGFDHELSLQFSFDPERLWLWSAENAGSSFVMLQADDNGNSYLSARDSNGEQWRITSNDGAMGAVVIGDVVVMTPYAESGNGYPNTVSDLLGVSAEDGSVQFRRELDHRYHVVRAGRTLLLIANAGDDAPGAVVRLDPVTFELEREILLPPGSQIMPNDRGLLVWNTTEAQLILTDSMEAISWATGASNDYEAIAPTVSGDTFIRLDAANKVSGTARDGHQQWSVNTNVGDVSKLWSPDANHLLVAGAKGFELFRVDDTAATPVASEPKAGPIGPTAIIDDVAYAVWTDAGTGHLVRFTEAGPEQVMTFPAENAGPEQEQEPPQATFVQNALLVPTYTTEGSTRSSTLTAYALGDGSKLWSLESEGAPELTATWQPGDGFITLLYGYNLIPGRIGFYG